MARAITRANDWSTIQLSADRSYSRRPDSSKNGMEWGRGYGDGRGCRTCFVGANGEEYRSHTGQGFPPQCMIYHSRGFAPDFA